MRLLLTKVVVEGPLKSRGRAWLPISTLTIRSTVVSRTFANGNLPFDLYSYAYHKYTEGSGVSNIKESKQMVMEQMNK